MPGRIPDHWRDRPSPSDILSRDRRILANERFLMHAEQVHGITIDEHQRVAKTMVLHTHQHLQFFTDTVPDHDAMDHYIPKEES